MSILVSASLVIFFLFICFNLPEYKEYIATYVAITTLTYIGIKKDKDWKIKTADDLGLVIIVWFGATFFFWWSL